MKKIITVLLAILLVAVVCVTAVAAGKRSFADANNNEICGNKENETVVCGNDNVCIERNNGQCANIYADANSDSICDNKDNAVCCNNITDADNDGICDNRNSENCGNNFTDVDNNGVCDNKTTKTGHHGNRNHHGQKHQ